MIIDCQGHYTTAPKELEAYRQEEINGIKDPSQFLSAEPPKITDNQIRQSLESAQMKFQR
jgi:4-oxalmesaconate hydratase